MPIILIGVTDDRFEYKTLNIPFDALNKVGMGVKIEAGKIPEKKFGGLRNFVMMEGLKRNVKFSVTKQDDGGVIVYCRKLFAKEEK